MRLVVGVVGAIKVLKVDASAPKTPEDGMETYGFA